MSSWGSASIKHYWMAIICGKNEQLYSMHYGFTTYGCPGLMVYNIWMSCINGIHRVSYGYHG